MRSPSDRSPPRARAHRTIGAPPHPNFRVSDDDDDDFVFLELRQLLPGREALFARINNSDLKKSIKMSNQLYYVSVYNMYRAAWSKFKPFMMLLM